MASKPSSKAGAKPAASSAPALPCGVYFDRERRTCIVVRVTHHTVHAVFMGPEITFDSMHVREFTRKFKGRWANYPLRRAARLYLRSALAKSETAARALRLLAASAS